MSKKEEKHLEKEGKTEQKAPEISNTEVIETLQAQVEEWKDKALRAVAEMENVRKRTQIDMEKTAKFANAGFAKDLLPVIDCLEGALACVPEKQEGVWKNLVVGIEMTLKQFTSVLKAHGIERMACLGQIFDPYYHKVVQEVPDKEKPAGTIVQELQAGYTIHGDRVLREAMVVVSKEG